MRGYAEDDGSNDAGGAGVRFEYAGTGTPPGATIANCSIIQNRTEFRGGGIMSIGRVIPGDPQTVVGGDITIVDCLIAENTAYEGGGARIHASGKLLVVNTQIVNNRAFGYGGGLQVLKIPSAQLTNTLVARNIVGPLPAYGGSGYGGGIYMAGIPGPPGLTLSNSTVAFNALRGGSTGAGGGLYVGDAAKALLNNSIVWNNTGVTNSTGHQIKEASYASSAVEVRYSNVQRFNAGDVAGDVQFLGIVGSNLGNVAGHDPLFVDPNGADDYTYTYYDNNYRLQQASPSIDSADNRLVPNDEVDLDLDGNLSEKTPLDLPRQPRFVDGSANNSGIGDAPYFSPLIVDMGAYEFVDCGVVSQPRFDCNHNGELDLCEIASGSATDCNNNTIMDGCEGSGDADFDCLVNLNDVAFFGVCKQGPGYPEGIACIYFDMDCDLDVDLADYSLFQGRFGTAPPVCSNPATAPCCDGAYRTLNVSTNATSGVTASIIPNPVWMNELELSPSGTALSYANAPSLGLSLLGGDIPSFLYWEVDGVPQTTGQQTVAVTMDETHSVQAVFAPPGEIVWDSDPVSPDQTTRSLRFHVDAAVTAIGSPGQDAIKVTMVDLQNPNPPNLLQFPPPNFSAFESTTCTAAGEMNGCARWVGKPGTFYKSQGPPQALPYRAARLQCAPFYTDWVVETASGPITVVGAEIAPSSEYTVQTYGASCMGWEAGCTNVSAAVTMFTRRKGDLDETYQTPSPTTLTQADAIDVAQSVNAAKYLLGAPSHARAQMQPNLPDLNTDLNVLDIVETVDSLKRIQYSFSGPCPCPSAVPCPPAMGSVACPNGPPVCVTAFGAGSMCVTTCTGGTNAGEPCIYNSHCPGGGYCNKKCVGGTNDNGPCTENPDCPGTPAGFCTDVGGFCRDSCGRCTP